MAEVVSTTRAVMISSFLVFAMLQQTQNGLHAQVHTRTLRKHRPPSARIAPRPRLTSPPHTHAKAASFSASLPVFRKAGSLA